MKEIIEKYKKQFKEVLNDLKTPGKRYRQIPNILTGSRLLAPFVIIPSVITGNFVLAGISTALFATTDLFDGLVARTLHITSEFGKDLDAFTDKIFVGTLMISLIFTNPFYIAPLIMEATIAGININKKIKNRNPESHMIGKVKMTSLYALIALGFLNMYFKVPPALINTLFASTLGLQVATIADYSKKSDNGNIEEVEEQEKIESLEDIEIKEETKEKVKEKEQTITQKYLGEYRNLREVVLKEKSLEEQKTIINNNIKINQKKNNQSVTE